MSFTHREFFFYCVLYSECPLSEGPLYMTFENSGVQMSYAKFVRGEGLETRLVSFILGSSSFMHDNFIKKNSGMSL